MSEVFWSFLPERSIQDRAVLSALALASRAGNLGYTVILTEYQRTDAARNKIASTFMEQSKDDDDCLVMLDCDHMHPHDTIERLVAHRVGVVGALAFRRTEPYDPCFFLRAHPGGPTLHPLEFSGGLMKGAIVGTGAICIRRWVFRKLDEAGLGWPYFKYEYHRPDVLREGGYQSEDVYFGLICERLGIPHYCDTSLVIPHLKTIGIDERAWMEVSRQRLAQFPEQVEYVKE